MSLQVETLRESFKKVKPQADAFVESFYDNLFTDYPAAKPLFEHSDMSKQSTMLKACLLMVVENLRRPGALQEMLSGLGTRHVAYGALPEHYPLVGNSLLKTFEQYLKEDWTEETKAAWVEAYGAITALMLEGADYSQQDVQLESAPVAATAPAATALAPAPTSAEPSLPNLDAPAPEPAPTPEPVSSSEGPVNSEASPEEASGFPALPVAGGVLGFIGVILLFFILL